MFSIAGSCTKSEENEIEREGQLGLLPLPGHLWAQLLFYLS